MIIFKEGFEFDDLIRILKKLHADHGDYADNPLRGYINWDASRPDYVNFGYVHFYCPVQPIHRGEIERVELGSTVPCPGGQMWTARLYLKSTSPTLRELKQPSGG